MNKTNTSPYVSRRLRGDITNTLMRGEPLTQCTDLRSQESPQSPRLLSSNVDKELVIGTEYTCLKRVLLKKVQRGSLSLGK